MKYNVLIVDDEKNVQENLKILLSDETEYKTIFASTGKETLKICETVEIDVILCDINLPDMNGFEILEYTLKNYPHIPVVIITAYSSWQTAREALKNGAFDFIAKPVKSDAIKLIIEKALSHRKLLLENILLKEHIKSISGFANIIGTDKKIKEIQELIIKVAPTTSTVLITGESGTGKELVAKAIHERSLRKDKNFLTVNCGAIPANLLESELFGYIKGAFTGAVKSKAGYFEIADGGTLFLDEIGELSIDLQVKILRVVEGYSFMRVGGSSEMKTDVRIVAATNRDLNKMIEKGAFRNDLYYRLAVFLINIPPLRERKNDIEQLVFSFIDKFNRKFNKLVKGVEPDVFELFHKYNWPGNIRELQNIIEHCMLVEDNEKITLQSLPELIKSNINSAPDDFTNLNSQNKYDLKIDSIEASIIESSLMKNNYNKSQCAKELGLSRQALQYKINKLKKFLKRGFDL